MPGDNLLRWRCVVAAFQDKRLAAACSAWSITIVWNFSVSTRSRSSRLASSVACQQRQSIAVLGKVILASWGFATRLRRAISLTLPLNGWQSPRREITVVIFAVQRDEFKLRRKWRVAVAEVDLHGEVRRLLRIDRLRRT